MSTAVALPDPLPTNDAIEWTGQRYGLKPYLDEGADLGSATPDDVDALAPQLVEALDDPTRFAAAHVLLTRLSRVTHETFPDWNGMAVELAVDGSAHVDPVQRGVLARRWRAWLEADPHPAELPAEPLPEPPADQGGRIP